MKKSPEQIYAEANFHLEVKQGLLQTFRNSPAFKKHITGAIRQIKLKGKSMLNATKKFSTNIFA